MAQDSLDPVCSGAIQLDENSVSTRLEEGSGVVLHFDFMSESTTQVFSAGADQLVSGEFSCPHCCQFDLCRRLPLLQYC